MKIFALNLCLTFELTDPQRRFDYTHTPFVELEEQLRAEDADERQFYLQVAAPDSPSVDQVFGLITDEALRQLNSQITFRFATEAARRSFLEELMARFHAKTAAGGLVRNERGEYLCIYNRQRWTLPKGHVEKGETIEQAATREVCEETGLPQVQLDSKLGASYHTYFEKGRWVLKTTHWFRMQANSEHSLEPQADEQIEAVRWLSKKQWLARAHESYPLNRAIFEAEFAQSLTS
jgi:8-oxo-dGTP pyrophosphatase MutT (NUDIX family)